MMLRAEEANNEYVTPRRTLPIPAEEPANPPQVPTFERKRKAPKNEDYLYDLSTCQIGNGPDAINVQQWAFIKILCSFEDPYVIGNQTKAALEAGYGNGVNEQSAATRAYELMRMHKIQEAIRIELNKRLRKYDITAKWVLERLAWTADCNIQDCIDPETGTLKNIRTLPRDVAHNIQKIKCTKTYDQKGDEVIEQEFEIAPAQARNKAKELLGKHLGLFTEKFEFVPGDLQQAQDARAQQMRQRLLEELGPEDEGEE